MNKEEILSILKAKINEKVQNFENLISETRASNNDTKSSMGDKYETGREMLQQEINNLQRQLNEALHQQNIIHKLSVEVSERVKNGALVKTDKGLFYISASLGEIKCNDKKIMSISEESPLAKAMFGKKAGESFTINTIQQLIEVIW
ncbi:GreA/GreB family elongation factor [Chryseobacterium oryctis]|uniref:GreA/GreB family elongation factor n=1 Tax=Chryseobacterium oryctis TaxID=2952618 RepID=A0ABT3HJ19_9FLAO|nr:GreA/GreB family elongation factor [Chryseobacterium oryctis]MCW3159771.1 GreA/GreB family elongation factor [Chryseobacterium oryctis]